MVFTPNRCNRSKVFGPTPHKERTGWAWRKFSSDPGAIVSTPKLGRRAPGMAPSTAVPMGGFANFEASLAINFDVATPTEHGSPSSVSMMVRILAAIVEPEP